jgi:hypothetical protein
LKEFRLSQTVERKKKLQMNLFKLDEKIGKLKSKLEAKSEIDVKNSMNRNLLINSPVTKSRVLKIPKMSDDSVFIFFYCRKEDKKIMKPKSLFVS